MSQFDLFDGPERSEQYSTALGVSTSDPRFETYWKIVQAEFEKQIPWLSVSMPTRVHLLMKGNEVIGGISVFDTCPENQRVQDIKRQHFGEGGVYISCFVVKEPYRKQNIANGLFKEVIKGISQNGSWAWCVAGNYLTGYYRQFGGESFPLDDNTSIVRFKE